MPSRCAVALAVSSEMVKYEDPLQPPPLWGGFTGIADVSDVFIMFMFLFAMIKLSKKNCPSKLGRQFFKLASSPY